MFYIALASLCFICWGVFLSTLLQGRPKYTDIIGQTPGLVAQRMKMNDNSQYETMQFNKNNAKFYIDETNKFVKGKV